MDRRLPPSDGSHHRLNGASHRTSTYRDRVDLQSLGVEEQESIQYLEEIINSMEKSLKEDAPTPAPVRLPERRPVDGVDGAYAGVSPRARSVMTYPEASLSSPKDEIIDLVKPDLVQTREPVFSPTHPDFQSMLPTPGSHFDFKPRHDPMDNLSSEYNPPFPSGSMGTSDSSYHPPGCIPTPVLIAQKIAENQAGGTSTFNPSALLRHRSNESEKPGADVYNPHSPSALLKPPRFPANISMSVGNKEQQSQSLANVNIHERKAQMLANLSGGTSPLQEELEPTEPRNTPTRSVSFRDPTPDKSRMEALSKLGLTRNRALSGGSTLLSPSDSPLPNPLEGAALNVQNADPEPSFAGQASLPEPNFPPPPPVHQVEVEKKTEIVKSEPFQRQEEYKRQLSPPSPQNKAAPSLSEVKSLEFNSYGGKSIVVKPSPSTRTEPVASTATHESKPLPPALAKPSEYNSYGGKSKVMTPVPAPRSDLPDILSSHINKSHMPPKLDPTPPEHNSYGGKSRSIIPSSSTSTRTLKPPAPAPAPKPSRNTFHGTPSKAPASHPEHKRRSGFRPQGITVQFSGRGATDESRKEALRKLGLLKES